MECPEAAIRELSLLLAVLVLGSLRFAVEHLAEKPAAGDLIDIAMDAVKKRIGDHE